MLYQTVPPPPALAPYVRCFWWLEGYDASYIHRSMADVCTELIFHYKGTFTDLQTGDSSFTAGLHGQSDTYSRFLAEGHFGIFGAYLYPYAIPALFGLPGTTLINQMPDLESCLGRESNRMQDAVMLAADNRQRVQLVTDFLLQKLASGQRAQPGVFEAIHYMIHDREIVTVGELSQKYALSARQFERNVKAATGFSPKLFSRIARFHSALQQYGHKEKSLTRIAYDCGYYDQSHFIHDFKAFSGHHPRHYFSGVAEGTKWKD